MALDLPKLRRLVAIDPADPLSRFALGRKLAETDDGLVEACDHLRFANAAAPDHLATYHVLAQALVRRREFGEARSVLQTGVGHAAKVTEGMGRDLGPAMQAMLVEIGNA